MDPISEKHIENTKAQLFSMLIICIMTFFAAFIALGLGSSVNLDLLTTIRIVFGIDSASDMQSAIIWELRFPRILMAIIGGCLLYTSPSPRD